MTPQLPLRLASAVLATLALAPVAFADPPPWAGHGKHGDAEQEYWDGHCKVERKWHHGHYREERRCAAPTAVYVQPAPVYVAPAPVVVQPAPVLVQPVIEPGLTIQGTIRLK